MRRLIAVALVLTACGPATGPTATSLTTTTSTTTTTSSEPGTTTTTPQPAVEPFAVGRTTIFEAGTTYEYGDLPLRVRFRFEEPGWLADVTRSSFVALKTADMDGIRPSAANVGFVVDPGATLDSVADELTSDRNSTPAIEVSVDDAPGIQFDIEGSPEEDDCDFSSELPIRRGFTMQEQWERPQVSATADCAWNRVWLLDVEGEIVLLHITHLEPLPGRVATLDELGPYVDDFINAITFCTEATPCDG